MRLPVFTSLCLALPGLLAAPSRSPAQYDVATALTLPLNGSASRYLDNSHPTNWWKVTVPFDGKLIVQTHAETSNPQLTILMWLVNDDPNYEIKAYNPGWGADTSVNFDNLMSGDYYVKVSKWDGAGSYTISSTFIPTSYDAESEKNDTPANAVTLLLGQSDTAHLGFYDYEYTDTVDWWKVSVPNDGKLVVTTQAHSADPQLYIMLWLYDREGKRLLKGYNAPWGNNTSVNFDNLSSGAYCIKAERYSGYGTYVINASFTPSALQADHEPNDSAKAAVNIPLDGSATGHLGFDSNGLTDDADWWKVTVPQDGRLVVTTQVDYSDPQLYIILFLFDKEGNNQIKGYNPGWGNHTSVNYDNLLPGTYYIKAQRYLGYGSYAIYSEFTTAILKAETEPNDSSHIALALETNGSATAHLGFYGNGYTDMEDWWKVTVPNDGRLFISTSAARPDSNMMIMLWLYDREGKVEIKAFNSGWGKFTTLNFDNLMPGNYHIRARLWTGFGSYTITSVFIPSTLEVESEPNDAPQNAVFLSPCGSDTAHLGFYRDGYTDTLDWWKVTIPRDGCLAITTAAAIPDSIMVVFPWLFDMKGERLIKQYDADWGRKTTVHFDNLKSGTYYIKTALPWAGFCSYAITSSFTPVHYANNEEPNDTRETAAGVSLEKMYTGHLGYYGENGFDVNDFFSFPVAAGWDTLFVRAKIDSTLTSILHMYDSVGTEWIANFGPVVQVAKPKAGTWYFHVSLYSGFGAYAFTVSNTRPVDISVPENEELMPPTRLNVSDAPNDNGHYLKLSWTLSPSEDFGLVQKYRIFRSRTDVFNNPAPRSRFTSLDALNDWEAYYAVLTDSVAAGVSEYIDFVPMNGAVYYYWVQAAGVAGLSKSVAAEWGAGIANVTENTTNVFRAAPAHPNPFNPVTVINYDLPEKTLVRIVVYDSMGRKVTTLVDAFLNAGSHRAVWNGRDASGDAAASGLYFYHIDAGLRRARGKMILLR